MLRSDRPHCAIPTSWARRLPLCGARRPVLVRVRALVCVLALAIAAAACSTTDGAFDGATGDDAADREPTDDSGGNGAPDGDTGTDDVGTDDVGTDDVGTDDVGTDDVDAGADDPGTDDPGDEDLAPSAESDLVVETFDDGAIDFGASETRLRALHGDTTPAAVRSWFDRHGVDAGRVSRFVDRNVADLDPAVAEILAPITTTVTVFACEASRTGWNRNRFVQQYVAWNLATQDGDPGQLRRIAREVARDAWTASERFCGAVTVGEPLPPASGDTADGAPPRGDRPTPDEAIALATDLIDCDSQTTATGADAALDFQATLVALGFIESFEDAADHLPVRSVTCFADPARSIGVKFFEFTDVAESLLAGEPILLGEDTAPSCWAVTGIFEIVVLGLSAADTSPNAVDLVGTLAPLDAPIVRAAASCG